MKKDTADNKNDWLAQELLHPTSTSFKDGSRTTKVLIIRFRWIIAISVIIISIAICTYFMAMSNPPYTVEIRDVAADGAVIYLPQQFEKWSENENIAAIRRHTFNRIYHSIYYHGLQYNFSRSGHVYAIEGTEVPAPFILVRVWNWSGDPHHFPYYNFSHTWNKGEP
jgi:hypothetical protein